VERILNNEIVGWFQGRLEFGSRALGNRSILANPANLEMKDKLNRLIKFRETFRPFAPSVLEEDAEIYFKDFYKSPYMTLTFDVKTKKLPAITHVDNTARVQSVTRKENRIYYDLIKKMKEKSGMGVVLNTSLNIMNMPIACSPKDAISVFSGTGMDILVLGNYVLRKN
jgi:carbamoyltransferase